MNMLCCVSGDLLAQGQPTPSDIQTHNPDGTAPRSVPLGIFSISLVLNKNLAKGRSSSVSQIAVGNTTQSFLQQFFQGLFYGLMINFVFLVVSDELKLLEDTR